MGKTISTLLNKEYNSTPTLTFYSLDHYKKVVLNNGYSVGGCEIWIVDLQRLFKNEDELNSYLESR